MERNSKNKFTNATKNQRDKNNPIVLPKNSENSNKKVPSFLTKDNNQNLISNIKIENPIPLKDNLNILKQKRMQNENKPRKSASSRMENKNILKEHYTSLDNNNPNNNKLKKNHN